MFENCEDIANTAQKMKFSIKDFFTFTVEILNGRLHFLCSVTFDLNLRGLPNASVGIIPITFSVTRLFLGCYSYPANIYLFKVDNRNTRKWCDICSKLTIKTPKGCG